MLSWTPSPPPKSHQRNTLFPSFAEAGGHGEAEDSPGAVAAVPGGSRPWGSVPSPPPGCRVQVLCPKNLHPLLCKALLLGTSREVYCSLTTNSVKALAFS